MARPSKYSEAEVLTPAAMIAMVGQYRGSEFPNEAAYREWFIEIPLGALLEQLFPAREVKRVLKERALGSSGFRIDILVEFCDGGAVAFELKATNRKNPQTAKYSVMQGVGQSLLYSDILSALMGTFVPVFLVADKVEPSLAALFLRHGLQIGLVEANNNGVICYRKGAGPHGATL